MKVIRADLLLFTPIIFDSFQVMAFNFTHSKSGVEVSLCLRGFSSSVILRCELLLRHWRPPMSWRLILLHDGPISGAELYGYFYLGPSELQSG